MVVFSIVCLHIFEDKRKLKRVAELISPRARCKINFRSVQNKSWSLTWKFCENCLANSENQFSHPAYGGTSYRLLRLTHAQWGNCRSSLRSSQRRDAQPRRKRLHQNPTLSRKWLGCQNSGSLCKRGYGRGGRTKAKRKLDTGHCFVFFSTAVAHSMHKQQCEQGVSTVPMGLSKHTLHNLFKRKSDLQVFFLHVFVLSHPFYSFFLFVLLFYFGIFFCLFFLFVLFFVYSTYFPPFPVRARRVVRDVQWSCAAPQRENRVSCALLLARSARCAQCRVLSACCAALRIF